MTEREHLFAGPVRIGRALAAPNPSDHAHFESLSPVTDTAALIRPIEIDEALAISIDGLSDLEILRRLEGRPMDNQLVRPSELRGKTLLIITGRVDVVRVKAVAEDVHFFLPGVDGAMTCFGGAIEVCTVTDDRLPRFGDSGSLVVTENGGVVGILIGGNDETHYVAPLYQTLFQNSYEFLTREWLSELLEVRMKRLAARGMEKEPVAVTPTAHDSLPLRGEPSTDDYQMLDESEAAELLGELEDNTEHAA